VIRSSLPRALVLRFFGLLVFAGVGLVAIRLVAFGVGSPPGWLSSGLSSFSAWVSTSSAGGVDILVGAGLVVLAALAALIMVPRRSQDLPTVQQGPDGSTWVDTDSVAEMLQCTLRSEVGPTIDVRARRGHLQIVTPFAPSAPFEIADRASAAVRQELEALGLADTVPFEIVAGSETKRRVR
jgi:hypothetical protein